MDWSCEHHRSHLSPRYEGEVTLQEVALRLPTHEIAVTEINGTVQITPEALITTSLTGNVGRAPVTG
jgi:hypothetical protein